MHNVIENPHVGLLFLIPGLEKTLRVNSRGWITRDEDLLARMAVGSKRPALGIAVQVEICYIHCAKAFKRSGLWEPGRWPGRADMTSISQMLVEHVHTPGVTVAAVDRALEHSYGNTLS